MSVIALDCYEKFCNNSFRQGDYIWPSDYRDGDIVYCAPEDIKRFFDFIKNADIKAKIILVTSGSDYGIHYQAESHPNFDISKCVYAVDYGEIAKHNDYVQVSLETANYEQCVATDKFSVKMDRYTINTFPEIPPNIVKWFCANANIQEPQVEFLPYGVNNDGHGKDIISSYKKAWWDKEKEVYANFQINSIERLHLKDYLRGISYTTWLTFVENPNLPVEKYYEELANHQFTIATSGNGLDSYRVWEALELGTIPMIQPCRWSANLLAAGFNVVVMDLFKLDGRKLEAIKQKCKPNFNAELISQEYWKNKIEKARELI